MGLTVVSFAYGPPYEGHEQELWYRYGSAGFLLIGAIVPAVVILSAIGKQVGTVPLLTLWMFVALLCFCVFRRRCANKGSRS